MDVLRVLVVGDDPLARSGLLLLLSGQPGVEVAGQAAPGDDLGQALRATGATIVVWDVGLPPSASLEGIGDLDGVPVLAILAEDGRAGEALSAGAHAALLRDTDSETLLAGLRALARGLFVLDPGLAEAALRPRGGGPAALVEDLTPREIEVLSLLAQGLSNKAIAERLRISDHTAKFHVNAILGKLGAESRTEAVVLAARLGLVSL